MHLPRIFIQNRKILETIQANKQIIKMCVKVGCVLAVEIVHDNERERIQYILTNIDKCTDSICNSPSSLLKSGHFTVYLSDLHKIKGEQEGLG